uniref:Uncharacterized protein n=1 Tax=Arundo donax TaxID=35708 RepID=A0A0A9E0A2_ARUDO
MQIWVRQFIRKYNCSSSLLHES